MKAQLKNSSEEKMTNDIVLSQLVKSELDKVRKRVLTKDRDFVAVVDGEEGVGKSVLAFQIAKYLDPSFDIDRICFNSDQFLNKIKDPKIKKGSAIVLDEAFAAANSRASLTDVNRAMIGVATEMRQKNLFVLLCIPSFFDLDRYFALWRCRVLFHVYFTPEEDRRFIIFPKDLKKQLYLMGKKTYSYAKPHSSFPPFNFSNNYMIDEQEYRLRKAEAFRKRVVSNLARRWLAQRNAFVKYLLDIVKLDRKSVGDIPIKYGASKIGDRGIGYIVEELEKDENKEVFTKESEVLDEDK
jgi:ABC-type dipeptide/oligopeptide/nickel transport system ATPase component